MEKFSVSIYQKWDVEWSIRAKWCFSLLALTLQTLLWLCPVSWPLWPLCMDRWLRQHEYIEKLNMQAILNANEMHEEFIKDLLVSFRKVTATSLWVMLTYRWRAPQCHFFPLLQGSCSGPWDAPHWSVEARGVPYRMPAAGLEYQEHI